MKTAIFLVMLILVASYAYADDAQDIKDTLNEYYFAFIGENMDAYLIHSFTDHLSPEELEDKKRIIQEMWDTFDSGFAIDGPVDVIVDGPAALAEYNLAASVSDGTDSMKYSKKMIAILFYSKDQWKVFQAMPRAQFDFNMNRDMLTLDFANETPETVVFNETVEGCSPDLGVLSSVDYSLADYSLMLGMIGNSKKIKLSISDAAFFFNLEGQVLKSSDNFDADYEVMIDPCTFDRLMHGANPKKEYDEGNIKIKANSAGDSIKLFMGNIFNFFYTLFNRQPYEQWVEAETGTLENAGSYSFMGATSRGPGELYLGDGGAKATYRFTSSYAGKAHIYLWVSDDGLHRDGARSVDFTINGALLPYSHKSANYIVNGDYWGREYLGQADIIKGENTLIVTKPKTTSAAFTMDKLLVSEKER